jgi:hypothetical protein
LEEIMANSAPGGANDYYAKIIEEFRANGGRVGGPWAGTTLVLIHHLGARSGIERVSPLGCFPQGDGRFAVAASHGGSPYDEAGSATDLAYVKTTSCWDQRVDIEVMDTMW